MNSNIAPQPTQDDAVLKLKCPECSGGLNLRRKHLGISGKCVHCKAPITAVDEAGIVALKHSAEVQAAAATAKIETGAVPALVATDPASPAPAEEADSQFFPPPMPAPTPMPTAGPELKSPEDEDGSTWGFPKREDDMEAVMPALPEEEPMELRSTFDVPDAVPTTFSSIAQTAPGMDAGAAEPLREVEESAPVLPGSPPLAVPIGFSEKPTLEVGDEVAPVEPIPEKEDPVPVSDPSDLFESKTEAMTSPLFSSGASNGEMNSGWGARVPNQTHASISPFSTGSAEPDPGFAETLFREKAEGDTGKIQPKSPFAELDGGEDVPLSSSALFGNSSAPKSPVAKPDEEVVLDGDGRPMREMTPEEKESFAKDIMHFGEYNKRSPWLKRIVKFFVTMAVLGGIGYAAYVFLPQEQVEVAKAKVLNWLEPGSVLMDYLPFEVSESEDGEKEVKIKALEGLDSLSTKMDAYLTTAEDQLNETLPEGAEGYEREQPIDMPQMPTMPKIPGLKLPTMPGMSAESGEDSAE